MKGLVVKIEVMEDDSLAAFDEETGAMVGHESFKQDAWELEDWAVEEYGYDAVCDAIDYELGL